METQTQRSSGKGTKGKQGTTSVDSTGNISVYKTHEEAETAVKELQRSGFDMSKLSIVGRDFQTDENVVGYYNIGDRTKHWGKLGAFWGGIWGIIVGSAFFVIPGIGPLTLAGTFISTLLGALEGAVVVGGLSALGAALYSIGIPKDSVVKYEADLKAGRFVMIAHGTHDELKKAREIAKSSGAQSVDDFESKDMSADQTLKTH